MQLPELAGALLPWYDEHARDLPWRQDVTPYRVWVSEIMLQQTRIETVRDYFARFMAALPTLPDLARAEEETVLKLWEGLGYYSRARNLHKAARRVMEEYGGELPRDAALLRQLPGIGEYTAGAIASLACGRPEPAVDGNVLRVCARLTACPEPVTDAKVKNRFRESLRAQYPADRCGDFTSAVMELGEVVCTPGTPDCESCPLTDSCLAYRTGTQTEYPVLPEKKPRRIEKRTVLLLVQDGDAALRRRPDKGLLAGLWEFPNTEGHLEEDGVLRLAETWGCAPENPVRGPDAVHVFSHLEWHMTGWLVPCRNRSDRFVWADGTARRERYAVPTAFRAYRTWLEKGGFSQ